MMPENSQDFNPDSSFPFRPGQPVDPPVLVVQGGLISYRQPEPEDKPHVCGRRGKVKPYMTDQSRYRLMRKFASLDWPELSKPGRRVGHLTLSTPQEYWFQHGRVYAALRAFEMRLRRKYPLVAGVVRRELGEENGALHFHIFLLNFRFIPVKWLRESWRECLGYDDTVQVRIERRRGKSCARYLAKYCAKVAYARADDGGSVESFPGSPVTFPAGEASGEAGVPGGFGPAEPGVSLTYPHNCTDVPEGWGETSDNAQNTPEIQVETGVRWWYVFNEKCIPYAEKELVSIGPDARDVGKLIRRAVYRWLFARAAGKYGFRKVVRPQFAEWLRAQRGGWCLFLPPEQIERLVSWAKAEAESRVSGVCWDSML